MGGMKYLTKPLAAAVATAALVFSTTGCVSDYSGASYTQAEARMQQTVYRGTLTSIEPVVIEGNEGTVGAVAGGVMGGALGSAVGGGSGNTIATVAGALVGAAAGAMAERNMTKQQAYALEVTMPDGRVMSVTQTLGNDTFTVGQNVKVLVGSNGTTRVRPD